MSESVPTEFLEQKLGILQQAVKQAALEIFNHNLIIEDAKELTGNEKADNTLKQQATTSLASIKLWERKLATRKPILDSLQSELDARNTANVPVDDSTLP